MHDDDDTITELIDAIRAADIEVRHALAGRSVALARFDEQAQRLDQLNKGFVESHLGATMHWPPSTTRNLLYDAMLLTSRFPDALQALDAGLVSFEQVTALVRLTSNLSDEDAREVAVRVLPAMPEQSRAQSRAKVDRAIQEVDPDGYAERHAKERTRRRVEIRPEPDGMATFSLYTSAETARGIMDTLNHHCRSKSKYDHRTLDQRRADTLAALILTGTTNTLGAGTVRAMVLVVVNAESLIGLTDTPAHLEGYGPITAAQARALATAPGSELRRLFVDRDGALLKVDPHKYRRTAALDRHIQALHRTCSFPGCGMPAWRSEIDHITPYGQGGLSEEDNLHPACHFHHQQKTMGLWRVHREGNTIVWTSTLNGQRFISIPEPYSVIYDPPSEQATCSSAGP